MNKATHSDGLCDNCRKQFRSWDRYQKFKGSTPSRYGALWKRTRMQILQRDNYLCQECLKAGRYVTATDVDHIVPLAQGGTDRADNLQSLCHDCHKAKTARERLKNYNVRQK